MQAFLAEDSDPGLAVTLFDLVTAFNQILERARNRPVYEVDTTDVTVSDMMRYMRDRFLEVPPDQPVFILRIFEQQRSRRAMIVLFLAVLELVRMQAVVVTERSRWCATAISTTFSRPINPSPQSNKTTTEHGRIRNTSAGTDTGTGST
jgi:hypothetical protein